MMASMTGCQGRGRKMAQALNSQSVRPLDPNVKQRIASDPDSNIWVNASAGTGKTKVLTDRVLRLLLPRADGRPGSDPHKILCLTFTKAGASEMILRLQQTLARWVVMPLEGEKKSLRAELENLFGHAPTSLQMEAARQLFNQIIDLPGGLKIMTIHSFCQSVLARFPLEAGISPHMVMLEEDQARTLLKQAVEQIYRRAEAQAGSPLAGALDSIARTLGEDQFMRLLDAMMGERDMIQRLLRTHFDVDGLYQAMCADHDISPALGVEDIIRRAIHDSQLNRPALRDICVLMLGSKSANERERAAWLDAFLAADSLDERAPLFDLYLRFFLTQKGEPRQKLLTKSLETKRPGSVEFLEREAVRLTQICDEIARVKNCALTRDLFRLGTHIMEAYSALKQSHGALDFDDQILKTLALLRKSADWVLYKLDRGIDHILVDEAQDTNPEQWQIIEALCQEFYTHDKASDAPVRTIFVVGDEKQSIYGFQRASPEKFTQMRTALQARVQAAGQVWHNVDLQISFRSVPPVLSMVDHVFAPDVMRAGVSTMAIEHQSYRRRQAGLVELWPPFETPRTEQDDVWAASLEAMDVETGSLRLAADIAQRIADWLDHGEILPSRGRAVRAGDIMILVRTRTAFVHQLMRALKAKNVPVSGADRMVLTAEISVRDMMAAIEFCLLPDDDLTLACLLKSPLIGLDEEGLFDLAYGRSGSLWSALQNSDHHDIVTYLKHVQSLAMIQRPFEFLNALLFTPCPASEKSGLAAMKNRLGDDVVDPLYELVNQALDFEKTHIPTLQLFSDWMNRSDTQVKRDGEKPADEVRIMTVHGSKGLQAPIVILPDCMRAPGGGGAPKPGERLLWPDKTGLTAPIWTPRSEDAHSLYKDKYAQQQRRQIEEDKRLLYVAMTRAEDRLYIGGYAGLRPAPEACWYQYVAAVFENHPWCVKDENGCLRISTAQDDDPDRLSAVDQQADIGDAPCPDWLFQPAAYEERPPRPFAPSRDKGDLYEAARRESQMQDGHSFEPSSLDLRMRGIVMHKLLEVLPALPPANRRAAGRHYLGLYSETLAEELWDGLLDEIFSVLDHPDFSGFFSAQALAEVPIVAQMDDGRLLNGVIDRLYVDGDSVWILDYKTGLHPPDDMPPLYQAQMQAYAQAVGLLYPEKTVKAALLWTAGPHLMMVDI